MATPPRKLESQVIHCIRKRIAFGDTGAAAGIEVGVIPAGSHVGTVAVSIEAAFNAGTTNVLTVGTTASPSGFAATANTIPGTAGYKSGLSGTLTGNVTADTQVLVFYSQTGTAATAGIADVLVHFYPHPL